jgi:hypothetical protein
MKLLKKIFPVLMTALIFSCETNDNVISGAVTYYDKTSNQTIDGEGADVYLYKSIVVMQNYPSSYLKKASVGSSGYYSLFGLQAGPYYVYCEKLDSSGNILGLAGTSTLVTGNETRILNLTLK